MDAVKTTALELESILKPLVSMIVQEVCPRKDEISYREACKLYDRVWIDWQIAHNNITPRYKGSRKMYSRAEIELLIAAEKKTPSIVIK